MSLMKNNLYRCQECGFIVVTIDKAEGVTPFMIGCRSKKCQGEMYSSFYSCGQSLRATYEWYHPNKIRQLFLHRLTKKDVKEGMLLLRKIKK